MTAFVARGETRSAAFADWLARFDLLLFVVAGLSHRYGLIATPDFFWILALVGGLAIVALVFAAIAFRRLWLFGDRGGKLAARATLIALLVLAPFLYSGGLALHYPALNDISTDLDDPPRFTILGQGRTVRMNPIDPLTVSEAEQQIAAFPAVTGRRYEAAPDTVLVAIDAMLAARGWRRAGEPAGSLETGELTLEATASSLVFGFVSDIAIRVTDEGETSYVDMRSLSRFGTHDLGSNALRINSFLNDLDGEVASRAGGQAPG